MMYVLRLIMIVPLHVFVDAQDVIFYMNNCFNIGDDLVLNAIYNGNSTLHSVSWYYSKKTDGNNLFIRVDTCKMNGVIPDPAYNISRMTFKCPTLGNNRFQLIMSNLQKSEMGYEWGVDFKLKEEQTTSGLQKNKLVECILPETYTNVQFPIVSVPTTDPVDANKTEDNSNITPAANIRITAIGALTTMGAILFVSICELVYLDSKQEWKIAKYLSCCGSAKKHFKEKCILSMLCLSILILLVLCLAIQQQYCIIIMLWLMVWIVGIHCVIYTMFISKYMPDNKIPTKSVDEEKSLINVNEHDNKIPTKSVDEEKSLINVNEHELQKKLKTTEQVLKSILCSPLQIDGVDPDNVGCYVKHLKFKIGNGEQALEKSDIQIAVGEANIECDVESQSNDSSVAEHKQKDGNECNAFPEVLL